MKQKKTICEHVNNIPPSIIIYNIKNLNELNEEILIMKSNFKRDLDKLLLYIIIEY